MNEPERPADDDGERRQGPSPNVDGEARLSIGALSRATGIPTQTLRTWETRYDFPRPERKPSGHRRYPASSAPRLTRIAAAIELGHRASDAVPATDAELSVLLRARPPSSAVTDSDDEARSFEVETLLEAVRGFDTAALRSGLEAAWARLGLTVFLAGCVGPLVMRVGEAWQAGSLQIRHEHFLTEQLGDLLRALRLQLEARAEGPLVAFATLEDESHGLGLQMAALTAASVGCRVLFLGTAVPVPQLAGLVQETGANAVAISASAASRRETVAGHVDELRALLPHATRVVLGAPALRTMSRASRPSLTSTPSRRGAKRSHADRPARSATAPFRRVRPARARSSPGCFDHGIPLTFGDRGVGQDGVRLARAPGCVRAPHPAVGTRSDPVA